MNGDLLREKREDRRLTQKGLAELVGLKPWSIAAYEAGRVQPSVVTAYKLSKVLDCPELLGDITTGNKITIFRNEKGLSQVELAEAVGVSRVAVSSWENDRAKPTAKMERLLAEVLGCRLSDLA